MNPRLRVQAMVLSNRTLLSRAIDRIVAEEEVQELTPVADTPWSRADRLGTAGDLLERDDLLDPADILSPIPYDSLGRAISETAAVDDLFD